VFTYSAICDVPEETLRHVTALLQAHRHRIGTRPGRRAAAARTQATLVLRWFRDDAALRILAAEARIPISTTYRYLHEGIEVIAEHAPDLHEVLDRAKQESWSHVSLDGTLIEIDRVGERNDKGHHLWYSGKHKTQGGNVQVLADPAGFPVWSSPVEPGSVHDLTSARTHCLGALYKAAADGVPTLSDKGYEGTGSASTHPDQGPRSRRREPQLQHAADRGPRDRGTRPCRTETTIEMLTSNPTVPEQNRFDRCRGHCSVDTPARPLLRKPALPT
jgi:hypothetical protein